MNSKILQPIPKIQALGANHPCQQRLRTFSIKALAVLSFLWLFAGLNTASADNMLLNTSAETGTLPNADFWLQEFGTADVIDNAALAHTGNRVWELTAADPGNGISSVGQLPMVSVGETFTISAWVKIPNASPTHQPRVRIRWGFFLPGGGAFSSVQGGTEFAFKDANWTQVTSPPITCPADGVQLVARIYVYNTYQDTDGGAALPDTLGLNFPAYVDDLTAESPDYTFASVSGTVTDGGVGVAGVVVKATQTVNSGVSSVSLPTDASGNYSLLSRVNKEYQLSATSLPPGKMVSPVPAPFTPTDTSPINGQDITLGDDPDYDADLLLLVRSSNIPLTGAWPATAPAGGTLARIGAATTVMLGSQQWEQNRYSTGDGWTIGSSATPIALNGGFSVVATIRPVRNGISSDWNALVNYFHFKMVLGVRNESGEVQVFRQGAGVRTGVILPDGQATVLSWVVAADGQYKIYVDGVEKYSNTGTADMTQIVPGTAAHEQAMMLGRGWDGWGVENMDIGDVYIYKTALDDAKRAALESDLKTKFDVKPVINASAGAHGTLDPLGLVEVSEGGSQTFTFTADSGYVIGSVLIDGIANAQAKIDGSYTFVDVTAGHTIVVSFEKADIDPNLPIVDISVDAAFTDDAGLTVWPNAGTLEGQFVAGDGFDTVAPMTRANIGGIKAVQFNGSKMLLSSTSSTADRIMAPSTITGAGANFTVIANIYAPGSGLYDPWEQMFLAWSRRGGPELTCASFGYGKGWWGAIGGWGAGDVNYGTVYPGTDRSVAPAWGQWNTVAMTYDGTTVKIYYNGAVVNTQTKAYVFHGGMPISLGSQYSGDTGLGRDLAFNGSLNALKIYTRALTDAEIIAGSATRYTIAATAATGGSITPSPTASVQTGTNATFTITPAYGYLIGDVSVTENGVTTVYPATDTYTFTNVTADGSINATFVALPAFSGVVSGPSGPIYSAKVALAEDNFVWTNAAGEYVIVPPADGDYTLTASKGGHVSASIPATMAGASVGGLDIALAKSAGLDPLVVLDASAVSVGPDLAIWPNAGSMGGQFNKWSGGTGPEVLADLAGKQAVDFSAQLTSNGGDADRRTLGGTIVTTAEIAGRSDWTVSADLYKANMAGWDGDNAYLSLTGWWAGNSKSAQFCYVNNKAVDYNGTGVGFNTVPSGSAWHNVTITYDGTTETIYVDGTLDRSRTIALNIAPGDQIIIGSHSDVSGPARQWNDNYWRYNGAIAKLQIFDQALTAAEVAALNGGTPADPYADWLLAYPSLSGDDALPGADPDGDGRTNQEEFAFGLNPTLGSSVNPIAAQLNRASGEFSYTRLVASDLSYSVWTSTDLMTWTEDAGAIQAAGAPDGNGVATVAVTLSGVKPLSMTSLFVRVEAQ